MNFLQVVTETVEKEYKLSPAESHSWKNVNNEAKLVWSGIARKKLTQNLQIRGPWWEIKSNQKNSRTRNKTTEIFWRPFRRLLVVKNDF